MFKHTLLVLIGLIALIFVIDNVEAHTQKGGAFAFQTIATGSRCFWLDQKPFFGAAPDQDCPATIDDTTHPYLGGDGWNFLSAGDCLTFVFQFDTVGVTPPVAPNVLELGIRSDNTGTIIKTFVNGGPPADGTEYQFCFTTNGNSGNPGRIGTYRAYVRAIKNDAPGGIGNYDVNSDSLNHRGAIKSTIHDVCMTASTPPAGAFHAYTGTEAVTISVTHDTPNVDANVENTRIDSVRASGAQVEAGSSLDRDSGSYNQAFTIDNTYDAALTNYGGRLVITGEAALLTGQVEFTSDERKWTEFGTLIDCATSADLTRVSAVEARLIDIWSADPRLLVDSHTQSETPLAQDDFPTQDSTESHAFIIGEDMMYVWCHVDNARGEALDTTAGTITITVRDPDDTVQETLVTQTGADGWTADTAAGRITFTAAPPSGEWIARCSVAVTQNSGFNNQIVTFVSAFTANLICRPIAPSLAHEGENFRTYVISEIEDTQSVPQTVPNITIARVVDSGGPAWQVVVPKTQMLNAIDDTATVNGILYYFETALEFGTYNIRITTKLNSVEIRCQTVVEVMHNDTLEGTLFTFAPLILTGFLIIFHEYAPSLFSGILVLAAGIITVISLPSELNELRIILIGFLVIYGERMYFHATKEYA